MMRFNMPMYCDAILVSLALLPPVATLGQAVKVAHKAATPEAGGSTLTVSVSPSAVSFKLVAKGAATGNNPFSITTAWKGLKSDTIDLYGYFTTASAALTGNLSGDLIPTSCVLGK